MYMKLKAQSAMEYLMTYGWAILIVIIVAAALYALGLFNPQTYVSSTATGFANLGTPSEWQFQSSTDTLTVVLQNQKTGMLVTINNVTANCGAGGTEVESTQTASGTVDIAAGSTATFTFSCGEDLNSGDGYNYKISIKYIPSGNTLEVPDSGTITGKAV